MAASTISTYQLWYGRDEPPVERLPLRAGPLTAILDGRDLRHVRLGNLEVVSRIYVAVRDRNWGTVPGEVTNVNRDLGPDHFTVSFDVSHRQGDIDFSWHGQIVGAPDGTLTYRMDGAPGADVTYKLIGLNTHHPMKEYTGRPFRVQTPEGQISGVLPTLIGPQLIEDETEVPLFPPVEGFSVELADQIEAHFAFEGDTFEVEDQRNWTDASFKAQSFPPRRNGFFASAKGQRIMQQVTVWTTTPPRKLPPIHSPEEVTRIDIGQPAGRRLPQIGFGMASHSMPLSLREAALLKTLRPDHVRTDLNLATPSNASELERAIDTCRALRSQLELALFVTDEAERQLAALANLLRQTAPPVVRLLVFHEQETATAERWLALARTLLRDVLPDALLVGGTNANFCELNRHRPERAPTDGVVYSINPQIHAFDETSLVENLPAQAQTVATARSFSEPRPIIISPITFKPRFNAVATEPDTAPGPGELPSQVDPRQMSLFGAAWTLGSVKYLAVSGASSMTYYETTGWRGVIETDAGSSLPERFPSRPRMVYPMYHVFADLAEWKDGELLDCASSDPLTVEALAIQDGSATHFLLASLVPHTQPVRVGPFNTNRVSTRRLNAANAMVALIEPQLFRTEPMREHLCGTGMELTLELAPFEIVRIDTGTEQ